MVNVNSDKEFISRIAELKDNLIDLSEKNIFLNFNWTRFSIPIIDIDFFDLFSKLVINHEIYEFTSEPKLEDVEKRIETEKNRVIKSKLKKTLKRIENFKNTNDDLKYYSQNTLSLFKNPEFYINRNEDLVLNTPFNNNDLQNRLNLINLKYEKSMSQEGVANLYLALGFAEYKNTLAPLIFIPVSLEKIDNNYKLFFNNFDEIKTNEYLNLKLKKDNISLPNNEIKTELDMISYLTDVNELINVKPIITLSIFNFKNIQLYNDLNLDNLSDDAKTELKSLLFNTNSKPDNIISDEAAEQINEKLKSPIYNLDLAQTSAIEEAKLGDNLIIDTLVGTEKTKTIIDLICELISNKKTVLYVSQKMNEIKNIGSHLNELGLYSIYLNLFGDNYTNSKLLNELDKTMNYTFADSNFNQDFYDNEIEKLNNLKIKLNNYSEFIEKPFKNTGFTPYKLLGMKETSLRNIEHSKNNINTIQMKNVSNLTNKEIRNIFAQISELTNFYSKNITSVSKHKFNYISTQDLSDNDFVKITENISKLKESLKQLIDLDNELNETYGIEKLKKLDDYENYKENIEVLYNNPQTMGDDAGNINELVKTLDKFQIKIKEYGSIEDLEKYLDIEVYNTKIDLKQHFEQIKETNEKITELITLLNQFKNQINESGIKQFNSIEETQESLSYLDILDKNPKLINDESALNVFIEDVERYQEKYNKNTPDNLLNSINNNAIILYDDSLNQIDYVISNKKNIASVDEMIKNIQNLQKEIGISKLNCIDEFNSDLTQSNLLLEDPKLIDDEDDLLRFFNDYKKGYDKFSQLSHEEYYSKMNDGINKIQDNISEELSKSNVLESNLPIIISEIKSILRNNERLSRNVYNKDIISLNQIDEYLDNINLLLKKPRPIADTDKKEVDGYINLLTDIINEESYIKLSLNEVNDSIADIIYTKHQLNEFKFKESVFNLDLKNILEELEAIQSKLNKLPLAISPIYDKGLLSKFNEYKNSKFKLIRSFTSSYGELKTELKSYYKTKAPFNDEQIISDYEKFFKLADEFKKYRNQVLTYYLGSNRDYDKDYKIVFIVGELNKFKDNFNKICDNFKEYVKSNKFDDVLSQLVLYRLKLSNIEDMSNMDKKLGKYFPKTYFRQETNLNELYEEYLDNEKYKELINNQFFPQNIAENIKSYQDGEIKEIVEEIKQSSAKLNYYITLINKNIDLKESTLHLKNVFSTNLEELNIYCTELLSEIRKSNDLFSDSLDNYDLKDIDELIKDYEELNSLTKIKSFLVLDTFENPLNNYKNEYQELCDYNIIYENNNELIDTYYDSIWEGRKTLPESITKRFNICKDFTKLFNEGFFTKNCLTFLNQPSGKIKNKISELNELCNNLTQKVSLFKNELIFYNDNLVKLKLNEFNSKNQNILNTIGILEDYKSNLLTYDKNNLINLDSLSFDSTKNVDELNEDLNKIYEDSNIKKYNISFDDKINHLALIKNNIIEYKDIVSIRDSINERKSISDNYFSSEIEEYNIWIGPNTTLNDLKNKSDIDKEFTRLSKDNFFTDKTIKLINNNPSVFNGFSEKIKNIFNKITNLIADLNNDPLVIHNLNGIFKDLDFVTMQEHLVTSQKDLNDLEDKYSSIQSNKKFDINEIYHNIKLFTDIIGSDYIISLEINQTILNNHLNSLEIKYSQLNELYDFKNEFDNISIDSKYFKHIWNNYDTSIKQLNQQIQINKKYETLVNNGFYNDKINLIFENNDSFNEFSSKDLNKQKIIEDCINYLDSIDLIHEEKGINKEKSLNDVLDYVDFLDENMEDLKKWRIMQKYCKDFENDCTRDYIDAINNDEIELELLMDTFNYNFANNLLNEITKENDLISSNDIDEFKKLDSEIIKLNRIKLLNQIKDSKPIFDNISDMDNEQISQYRGYSKLSSEFERRNHNSIKEILKESIDYIKCLKPVFLMNPMSVAQYLDLNKFESYFDYVIFDDIGNSSIENSITSLLRGKTKIILGDINQSSDFGLLNLCYPQFKDKSLKWHYQSKSESLIEFSNSKYYNDELIIYPSCDKNNFALELEYLDNSVYNPKTNYNELEAEKIVEYAINHFKKYGYEKTLGIIALTKSQRDLIINTLINKLYNLHPQLINYFNPLETFFVKNVTQVDETRDIILVSLTYGLDKNKKFNNYFDLNNEKIINQLLTKSHEKTIIFSNITSENIEIDEETPKNIQTLKELLTYIEHQTMGENVKKPALNDFEQSIYDLLTEKEFKVEKQIGICGNYIDLVVMDNTENRYVIAIECDSQNYNKFKSSRDRIKTHQDLLKQLGWEYYHINTIDWLNSRDELQNNLINEVQKAIENDNKTFEINDNINIDDGENDIIIDDIEIELDDDAIEINFDDEITIDDIEINITENDADIHGNNENISIDNLIELFTD